jgi:ferredoxin-NADP reductase
LSLLDYWPLIRDAGTIARTMRLVRLGSVGDEPTRADPVCVRTLVERIHPPRVSVSVVEERWESRQAKTLALAPLTGALPPFAPGQHLSVQLPVNGSSATCEAVITSPPDSGEVIEITVVKRRHDPTSVALIDEVHRGDPLVFSGPKGERCFHPVRDSDDLVFVAQGEDIVSFVSTIEHLLETRPSARVLLLQGARRLNDLLFRERLCRLSERHPGRLLLKFFLTQSAADWSGESGPLTADAVCGVVLVEGLGGKTFFLGGPAALIEQINVALLSSGVRPGRIHIPRPQATDDVSRLPGWPVGIGIESVFTIHVPTSGLPLRALAGQPLLQALEQQTAATGATCRSGVCGACRVRLTRGDVFTSPGVTLRPSDLAAGYIYPCVSYPISDLTIDQNERPFTSSTTPTFPLSPAQ